MKTALFLDECDQLDELMTLICEELQLPPYLYDLAKERYQAVGNWLGADESPLAVYKPYIHAQGSLAIGTTTRPIGRNEFDLDLVLLLLLLDPSTLKPEKLLDLVEWRLRQHPAYSKMVVRKKRCISLQYRDEFHLDTLPAVPYAPAQGTRILIPDRKLQAWLPSDPKGYASWFRRQMTRFALEGQRAQEPLPEHEDGSEKTPLQLAVQLWKRWRDLVWIRTPDAAPRSIVLTTMAGQAYQSETTTVEALDGIIDRALERCRASLGPLRVVNPASPDEVLTERWETDPALFDHFVTQLADLQVRWRAIVDQRDQRRLAAELYALFGEEVTKTAFRRQAERVEEARRSKILRAATATGILTTMSRGAALVRPNTFHGDYE